MFTSHFDRNISHLENHNQQGQCIICFELILGEVKNCPHCGKLYCQKCLNIYKEPHCANCRHRVLKHQYLRNRFAEETIEELLLKKYYNCPDHRLDKCFFCETCEKAACPDCWIEYHQDHQRRLLKDVYNERNVQINELKS